MPEDGPKPRWPRAGWIAPLHLHITAVFLAVLGLIVLALGLIAAQRSGVLVNGVVSAVFGGAADRALDGLQRL